MTVVELRVAEEVGGAVVEPMTNGAEICFRGDAGGLTGMDCMSNESSCVDLKPFVLMLLRMRIPMLLEPSLAPLASFTE